MKTLRNVANFAFAALTLAPSFALAASADEGVGEITIVGNGEASAAPEFARVSIDLTSICYDTSRAAKDANAQLANKLIAVMQQFVTTDHDQITTSGGANELQTETTYTGSESVTLCQMKWRATNTIYLQVSAIDKLADIQDEALAAIDASRAGQGVNPEVATQTYAELHRPSFHLFSATKVKLRSEAQGLAYDDAKAQFDTFAGRCDLGGARLTTIETPTYEYYARLDGGRFADAGSETPVIPDDITVSASWRFKWTFVPTSSCPQ